MQAVKSIEEKLSGRHESFLRYCRESGKQFVDELDREDFIAYRSEYAASREQVERIKSLLDFQERKPDEKIPPLPKSFDAVEDTLQSYFGIADLAPYEYVFLDELSFNTRVQRCLRRSGYKTLAELLRASRQKLFGLRNFGSGSFNNLLSTLKKFFTPPKKKIPLSVVRRAEEELGEFLRDAALNRDPQIDLIIAACEAFSSSQTTTRLFHDLPEDFKDKRARPFFLACGLDFIAVPEDLTLAALPAYLADNAIACDADKLKHFVDALRFDVRACAKKIVAALRNGKREFEVVRRRAEGATLEEIGKDLGVTRERIRQLELKAVGRFKSHSSAAKKVIYFLHALTDGSPLITLDDAKNFLDAVDAEILWFFVDKINFHGGVHFDEKLNAIIFADKDMLDDAALIKGLPVVMEEKCFEETVEALAREKSCSAELIRIKLAKVYKHSGKIFHRGGLTLTFKCGYVLKERFRNGYKIADENFYSRFMRYLREVFDETTPLTQRNVDAKIGVIGVLCDRGKYIHPDFVDVSPGIIERVKDFIDRSERTAIFYKELFETFKSLFIGTQVTNHYFLQGVLKLHRLPYTLRKDYLTKADEVDMGKEFDSFVAERGEVSAQEVKENFVSFTDANINFLLTRCPEVIRTGEGILIHASRLNLHAEDFESIRKFLRLNCSTPVHARVLLDLFFERFADFLTRNDIQTHNKLFGVLQHMFQDEFNFSRPYVSTTDITSLTNKKVLLLLLTNTDAIEIEDLLGICAENAIHYVARTYLIDSLRPDFIRVDEFTLMRPEAIGVTEEIISAVVTGIRAALGRNGGWQTAQAFEDYEWLPQLDAPWNSFLLESVASLADDAPCTLKVPSTSTNFSSTIFLAEEFAEDDFQTFLLKVLAAEHAKEPFRTEKEIFAWLKGHGLCNKKLPKFLEGRTLKLLNE